MLGLYIQRMFFSKRGSSSWSPEVSCVYFDAEKESLVEVRMYPEDLERIQGLLPYLPK
ncbi:hypothetical protein LEP1GSC163_1919 [Leptospira santarosai str. CBC379]|nr:hypothetical protein LEP1GSC163_1919 [Leptospira santarosai str. CBC379]